MADNKIKIHGIYHNRIHTDDTLTGIGSADDKLGISASVLDHISEQDESITDLYTQLDTKQIKLTPGPNIELRLY